MPEKKRTLKEYFLIACKGYGMGIADIIPGISGGTIAFILGIYEEFIDAIRSFDLDFVRRIFTLKFKEAFAGVRWRFLSAVFGGIICAILTLAKAISWCLEHQSEFLYAFFFGLILATIPIIARIIKKWTCGKVTIILIATVLAYIVVSSVPVSTPNTLWFLFISGALAISAMILPGISGSFILLILGQYSVILEAINERDILSIGVFLAGIVVGIVTFVRVLSWLFHKAHDITVAAITGIVIGSLTKIWPWKETLSTMIDRHGDIVPKEQINIWPSALDTSVLICIALMILGFLIAVLINAAPGELLSKSSASKSE